MVSLRDPDASEERTVDAGGTSFILAGFKDDPEWADFVADRLVTGIPVLERLVGTPWPGGLERVREDASPSLFGYDGWFDPTDDEIVVGERLDDDLILHELSHAWVAGERFDERWVYEGLAQLLADRAVRETGGTRSVQTAVSRGDAGAIALNAWGGSASTRSAAVDGYAYPAALHGDVRAHRRPRRRHPRGGALLGDRRRAGLRPGWNELARRRAVRRGRAGSTSSRSAAGSRMRPRCSSGGS